MGEEPYEPPPELVALVKNSMVLLERSTLPPGWRRLNTAYPPYSLPDRPEVVQAGLDRRQQQEVEEEQQRWLAMQKQQQQQQHGQA